jgi:hypothetical protein
MGTRDRDWYREKLRKKRQRRWNDRRVEVEYDEPVRKRRWRWPYRLHPGLPWWVSELVRQTLLWGAVALVYLAWRRIG